MAVRAKYGRKRGFKTSKNTDILNCIRLLGELKKSRKKDEVVGRGFDKYRQTTRRRGSPLRLGSPRRREVCQYLSNPLPTSEGLVFVNTRAAVCVI